MSNRKTRTLKTRSAAQIGAGSLGAMMAATEEAAAAHARGILGTVSGITADHGGDGRPIDVMRDDWSRLPADELPRFIHNLRELVLRERDMHLNTRLELAYARRGQAETEIDLLHHKLRDADDRLKAHHALLPPESPF